MCSKSYTNFICIFFVCLVFIFIGFPVVCFVGCPMLDCKPLNLKMLMRVDSISQEMGNFKGKIRCAFQITHFKNNETVCKYTSACDDDLLLNSTHIIYLEENSDGYKCFFKGDRINYLGLILGIISVSLGIILLIISWVIRKKL